MSESLNRSQRMDTLRHPQPNRTESVVSRNAPRPSRLGNIKGILGPAGTGDPTRGHAIAQRLAATGWHDTTRLAASSWSVWRDICLTNQPNISNALGSLIAELQSLKEALDARDFNRARELFAEANASISEHRALHYSRFEKL